jgi:hypothetical protein
VLPLITLFGGVVIQRYQQNGLCYQNSSFECSNISGASGPRRALRSLARAQGSVRLGGPRGRFSGRFSGLPPLHFLFRFLLDFARFNAFAHGLFEITFRIQKCMVLHIQLVVGFVLKNAERTSFRFGSAFFDSFLALADALCGEVHFFPFGHFPTVLIRLEPSFLLLPRPFCSCEQLAGDNPLTGVELRDPERLGLLAAFQASVTWRNSDVSAGNALSQHSDIQISATPVMGIGIIHLNRDHAKWKRIDGLDQDSIQLVNK